MCLRNFSLVALDMSSLDGRATNGQGFDVATTCHLLHNLLLLNTDTVAQGRRGKVFFWHRNSIILTIIGPHRSERHHRCASL